MKKLLAIFGLLLAASAAATTLNPVQLLNPTGSTSGQAIVSTGASSAPGWANVAVANVTGAAPLASPTFTGTVTIPVGGVLTSSPTAGDSSSKIATTFYVQGSLNNTQGAAFTTLSASGNFTPSQTNGIVGTTTNNNANAGSVGEFVTANASSVALTNATAANITSISLTAGDWDVAGIVAFTNPGTSSVSAQIAGISTTSAAFGSLASGQTPTQLAFPTAVVIGSNLSTAPVRLSISTTTTVYLVAQANFTASTFSASGYIRARRVR